MTAAMEKLVGCEHELKRIMEDVEVLVRRLQGDLSDCRDKSRFCLVDMGRIAGDVSRILGGQMRVRELNQEIEELKRRM